jgi:hypothetical protein
MSTIVKITVLYIALTSFVAYAEYDSRIELFVSEQVEINTKADSQVSISKKGIINVQKTKEGIFLITALKPGFVIFNPTPISNTAKRTLISIRKQQADTQKNSFASSFHSNIKRFFKGRNIDFQNKKNHIKINCLHKNFGRFKEYLKELEFSSTPTMECLTIRVNLLISIIDSSTSTKVLKEPIKHFGILQKFPEHYGTTTEKNLRFSTDISLPQSEKPSPIIVKMQQYKIKLDKYALEISKESYNIKGVLSVQGTSFSKSIYIDIMVPIGSEVVKLHRLGSISSLKDKSSNIFWIAKIPIIGYFFSQINKEDLLKNFDLMVTYKTEM